jgi:phage-related minor tail protein
MNRQAEEMDGLKNSILQFFSITNAVQLFKSAVNKAMQTVKELDATMTEAAVVTEFDVSDMWDKLPIYSAQAQKLGVSINGMY